MASFTGTFRDTFTVRAPLEAVRDHFADPAQHAAYYGDLERHHRIDEQTIRFELPEHNYGVTRFRGNYTCRYQVVDDRTVRWETVGSDHNIHARGRATLSESRPGAVEMDYDATLVLDIDVGRLLHRVIGPIVAQSISREMRAFVERMVAAVERQGAD